MQYKIWSAVSSTPEWFSWMWNCFIFFQMLIILFQYQSCNIQYPCNHFPSHIQFELIDVWSSWISIPICFECIVFPFQCVLFSMTMKKSFWVKSKIEKDDWWSSSSTILPCQSVSVKFYFSSHLSWFLTRISTDIRVIFFVQLTFNSTGLVILFSLWNPVFLSHSRDFFLLISYSRFQYVMSRITECSFDNVFESK